ncbi:MAG TPA: hypothetical protein VFQ80_14255, partial [Thermomicrobiales bacterium]|nr:hypothetical protein [Thermomicrobiales bacterium]
RSAMSETEERCVARGDRRSPTRRRPVALWPPGDQPPHEADAIAAGEGPGRRVARSWSPPAAADRRLAALLAELAADPALTLPALIARALVCCQDDPAMLRALAGVIRRLSPELATEATEREAARGGSSRTAR